MPAEPCQLRPPQPPTDGPHRHSPRRARPAATSTCPRPCKGGRRSGRAQGSRGILPRQRSVRDGPALESRSRPHCGEGRAPTVDRGRLRRPRESSTFGGGDRVTAGGRPERRTRGRRRLSVASFSSCNRASDETTNSGSGTDRTLALAFGGPIRSRPSSSVIVSTMCSRRPARSTCFHRSPSSSPSRRPQKPASSTLGRYRGCIACARRQISSSVRRFISFSSMSGSGRSAAGLLVIRPSSTAAARQRLRVRATRWIVGASRSTDSRVVEVGDPVDQHRLVESVQADLAEGRQDVGVGVPLVARGRGRSEVRHRRPPQLEPVLEGQLRRGRLGLIVLLVRPTVLVPAVLLPSCPLPSQLSSSQVPSSQPSSSLQASPRTSSTAGVTTACTTTGGRRRRRFSSTRTPTTADVDREQHSEDAERGHCDDSQQQAATSASGRRATALVRTRPRSGRPRRVGHDRRRRRAGGRARRGGRHLGPCRCHIDRRLVRPRSDRQLDGVAAWLW